MVRALTRSVRTPSHGRTVGCPPKEPHGARATPRLIRYGCCAEDAQHQRDPAALGIALSRLRNLPPIRAGAASARRPPGLAAGTSRSAIRPPISTIGTDVLPACAQYGLVVTATMQSGDLCFHRTSSASPPFRFAPRPSPLGSSFPPRSQPAAPPQTREPCSVGVPPQNAEARDSSACAPAARRAGTPAARSRP